MHITIREGKSLPELKRCTTCCKDFHCPFCRSALFRPTKLSKVRSHLESHVNRAVLHEGYTIHRCGLDCRPQWHYHCIHCQSMLSRKLDFIKHLSLCKEKHPAITPTTPAPTTLTVPTTPSGQMQRVRVTPELQKKCPICQVLMNKKNVKRHIERKHTGKHKDITASSHLQSDCIDPENGVYTVHKSFHGTSTPLHVQTKVWGEKRHVSCESTECQIHPTIQRRHTLPQALKVSSQLFRCPFCCEKKFKAARQDKVVTHLEGHFNRAVVHGDFTIHRCGLGCRDGLHFHCLYCGVLIGRRNDFRKHLQHCKDEHHPDAAPRPPKRKAPPQTSSTADATPASVTVATVDATAMSETSSPLGAPPMSVTLATVDATPISETSSPLDAQPVSVTMETVDATPISMTSSSPMSVTMSTVDASPMSTVGFTPSPLAPEPTAPQKERRVVHTRCPVCHLLLNKNNLKKHIERKHREKLPDVSVKCHLTSQRVDQEDNGIYAVLRSCSGHSVPVHVHVTIACDCHAAEQPQTEDVPE